MAVEAVAEEAVAVETAMVAKLVVMIVTDSVDEGC